MRSRMLLIANLIVLSLSIVAWAAVAQAEAAPQSTVLAGQDIYLQGPELNRFLPDVNEYVLVFENGLSLSVGAYQFSADRAIT